MALLAHFICATLLLYQRIKLTEKWTVAPMRPLQILKPRSFKVTTTQKRGRFPVRTKWWWSEPRGLLLKGAGRGRHQPSIPGRRTCTPQTLRTLRQRFLPQAGVKRALSHRTTSAPLQLSCSHLLLLTNSRIIIISVGRYVIYHPDSTSTICLPHSVW